ncbi:MAG: hypothetical protein QN187_14780 [Armatimonadota bacterium]|nr:hypothetical protein [Armatimonadota bacterium]MDR7520473.1 hypothetical protein [Armatimonadota bacterium]MDR7548519.1 hypothetical protein [Armatimonadota bacterium]
MRAARAALGRAGLGALLLVHVLMLFVSHASVALAIGHRLVPGRSRYAAVAIGVGLIAVATTLPYGGWLLRLLAIALGFGAVGLFLSGQRLPPPAPAG